MLGYLPQDFGVYPHLDALSLLDHFAVLKGFTAKGERKAVVEALLHRVNLWDKREQKLGGFSGGMRQRRPWARPRLAPGPRRALGLAPGPRRCSGEHLSPLLG